MDSLERRREINRRAARKSRSRRKEAAASIRKKYLEAQSANTQLVYERNKLKRERNLLRSLLETHRCELLVQPGPSTPLEQHWQPTEEKVASFDLSQSDIEVEACLGLQSAGDLWDKEDLDAGVESASSSCSEDEKSNSSSSVSELSPSSEHINSSTGFTEQGINGGMDLILESDCDNVLHLSSEFSQNLDSCSYLTRRDDDFTSILDFKSIGLSSIFDEFIDFSTNSEDLVTTVSESITSPFDLLGSESVPADIQGIETETVSDLLCPETAQHQQSEALDLSKHGPLSQIRRAWSQGRQSPPSSVAVEKENFFMTETSSSLKTKRSSTVELLRVGEQNGKDFAGNIPLLVESFVVGEKC